MKWRFPSPVTRGQAQLLFLIAPPVFALLGGAMSLLVSYGTMETEAIETLQVEIFELAGWIAAISAMGGLLFAWVQLLRFKALDAKAPSESDRLKAWVEGSEDQPSVDGAPDEAPAPEAATAE